MVGLAEANRTYHVAQDSMALLPNYYRWSYSVFGRFLRGKVVELGSGSGLGIPAYVDRVDHVTAVDHDRACLGRIRTAWPEDKVTTLQADLIGDWRELQGIQADSVLMMDVIEHFADDETLLRKSAALLNSGGHLLVKVPAQSALYSAMDEASGHYRRYDADQLRQLAINAGLEIVSLTSMNRLGAIAYRTRRKRRSNFSRSFSPAQLRAINWALPLVRLGDVVPGLPGLSLVGVFRPTTP